jgi:hypothetical protein
MNFAYSIADVADQVQKHVSAAAITASLAAEDSRHYTVEPSVLSV